MINDDIFDELSEKYYFFIDEYAGNYGYCLPEVYYDKVVIFAQKLEKYLNENPRIKDKFKIHQIKMKFHWLRIYYKPNNNDIDELINGLEEGIQEIERNRFNGGLLIWKKEHA